MRKWCFTIVCFLSVSTLLSQQLEHFLTPSDTLHLKRKRALLYAEAGVTTAALIGLSTIWYSDFEQSKFRTIDDRNEWLQMDKAGHVFSTYQLARVGYDLMAWSGASEKARLWNSMANGLILVSAVEIMDGYSAEWGFSWYDMLSNAAGVGLFIGQQQLWQEQRLILKYSFSRSKYASFNPDKLGSNLMEELLKDYNGQTYWLSVNLESFLNTGRLPKWLNLAFGYGGNGMLSGIPDPETFDLVPADERYRQFYLSLDIDLNRIPTRSKVLKTLFSTLNFVKIPLPTLEFSANNKVVFRPLFF